MFLQKYWIAMAKAGKLLEIPPGASLWSRYDLEENVVTLYLSPELESLASELQFVPCDPPARNGIGMLFGAPDAWAVHFKGYEPWKDMTF